MSITLDSTSLFSGSTHQMPDEGTYENDPLRFSVYGVRGTLQITDERHGRPIRIECIFRAYATPTLLKAAIETIDALVPTLADKTLTVVVGANSLVYRHVTLDAVERLERPFVDGSGVNGWMQTVVMHFWQSDNIA